MAMTRTEIREKGKQVRWIFNLVCKTVLPYLIVDYSEEVEYLTTRIITRFCYLTIGVDALYEDYSSTARGARGGFRDTLSSDQLQAIADEELRISKRLLELPYKVNEKLSRPSDILNYIA